MREPISVRMLSLTCADFEIEARGRVGGLVRTKERESSRIIIAFDGVSHGC